MSKIIGIDPYTNSVVAVMEGGSRSITNPEGGRLTPSWRLAWCQERWWVRWRSARR